MYVDRHVETIEKTSGYTISLDVDEAQTLRGIAKFFSSSIVQDIGLYVYPNERELLDTILNAISSTVDLTVG